MPGWTVSCHPQPDAPAARRRWPTLGNKEMISIRPIEARDHPGCVAVAETLTEWFNDYARGEAIPTDLRHQHGFLAESDGQIVAFITLFVCDGRLNISWIAVRKDCHRQGVGRKLIARAEQAVADMGLTELATWTLGDGVEYEPYERTRAFYVKCGFRVYQRSQTDNPDCPEEIKIKKAIAQPSVPGDAGRRA